VLLAGGGTGGHVFPGLALAEEIGRLDAGAEVLFVGSPGGLEERAVPEDGRRLELVRSVKLGGALGLLRLPWAMLGAVRQALRVLDAFRPGVVAALGGYASCAPALAARRRRIPVVVLEQNAIPGRVSRFLSRFAVEVHATYGESVTAFPARARVLVTGNPVRASVLAAARRRAERGGGPADGVLHLLVAGGSQGARRLNQIFLEAARELADLRGRLRVTHLTGTAHHAEAAEAARGLELPVELVPFQKDMASLYAGADLVLSRAGATGLAEISVCGLPVVLVPYPYAKDNHQEANARSFLECGAALLLAEKELTGPRLAAVLRELLEDGGRREAMAARMKERGRPEAGARIAARLLELAGGRAAS
jgi:UDP-N-acetylglucosamine--N-acetylmuramyl-(pentapeptide) pyrophosphoryl-undecaprenol N-acetylglucosamine transferase